MTTPCAPFACLPPRSPTRWRKARSLATEHEFTAEKIVSDETQAEETPAEYQQYLDPKYAEQLMSESLATSEEPEATPRKGPASEAVEELAGSSLNEH